MRRGGLRASRAVDWHAQSLTKYRYSRRTTATTMAMSEAKLLRDLGQLGDDADRLLRATQAAHRLAWNLPEAGADRGAFVAPLSALMDHANASVAVTAASALGALADGDPAVQAELSTPAALEGLVRLLGNDLVPGRSWRIAAIIGRLAESSPQMQADLIQVNGVKALVHQLDQQDTNSQSKAMGVLGIIARLGGVGRARIISFDIAPKLVKMSRSRDSSVRLAAVRLLALLAIDDQTTREAAAGEDGVHLLIGNGTRAEDPATEDYANMEHHGVVGNGSGEVAMWAASLLGRIIDGGTSGEVNRHLLDVALAARAEEALVRMLDKERQNAVVAADVLGVFGRYSEAAQQAIADAGGLESLVKLTFPTPEADVDPETDISQRGSALKSLNCFVNSTAEIRAHVVQAGGVRPAILAVEVPALQLPALQLLAALAKDAESAQEIAENDGINAVAIVLRVILTHSDDTELRLEPPPENGADADEGAPSPAQVSDVLEAGASALARLAQDDQTGAIQGIILHDGALLSLCGLAALVGRPEDFRTRLPIIVALGAIAAGNARTQTAIMEAGGLDLLVDAVASAEDKIQSRAAVGLLAFGGATEAVQRHLLRKLLASFHGSEDEGKHRVVVMLNRLAAEGTFWTVAVLGQSRFRRAARKVMAKNRAEAVVAAAAAEEARIAAGPPLGVSVKPGAVEGVDLKKGVFASTEGRWGQVLHDPDYQGDTKLRWINPPWMVGDTESDWVNSDKLSPAVADVSDLVENWPPEPEQEEKPSDQYVELLHREATREKTLSMVMAWLSGEHLDYAQAVKSMDILCACNKAVKEEIAVSPTTAELVMHAAKHLSAAIETCRVEGDHSPDQIWGSDAAEESGVSGIVWSAMKHRRKLFAHTLEDVRSSFASMDTGNTGQLAFDEFQPAMKSLDLGLDSEQLRDVFEAAQQTGYVDHARFADELHGTHSTPLQLYAHRMSGLLRVLTTMSMGRLMQSAAIAAVDLLAADASCSKLLVALDALVIMVDLQDTAAVTPYRSDPDRGNLASHARLALKSLFVHERSEDTVRGTMSALVVMVAQDKVAREISLKNMPKVFKPTAWANATIAIDSLEFLTEGKAGQAAALEALSSSSDVSSISRSVSAQAGPTAGAIGMLYNIIKNVTHPKRWSPSVGTATSGATATLCVQAAVGILTRLVHGDQTATRDIIGYGGNVSFFEELFERIPELEACAATIYNEVREYDLLRRAAEKLKDRELAEAAMRIQGNFRRWKKRKEEERARLEALKKKQKAEKKRRKAARKAKKGGKGKGRKSKGKKSPARARSPGTEEAPLSARSQPTSTRRARPTSAKRTRATRPASAGRKPRSSRSADENVAPSRRPRSKPKSRVSAPPPSDKELARRRLKAYNEEVDALRRRQKVDADKTRAKNAEKRRIKMELEAENARLAASAETQDVSGWQTEAQSSGKNSPMRISVPPQERSSGHRYDDMDESPTTPESPSLPSPSPKAEPAQSDSIDAVDLAELLNAPGKEPEPEPEPRPEMVGSSEFPALPQRESVDLKAYQVFESNLETIMEESGLTDEETAAAEKAFAAADRNGDGSLQISEFRRLLTDIGIVLTPQQFRAYCQCFFAKLDTDGSASLDKDEFIEFYKKCAASEELRKKYVRHVQRMVARKEEGKTQEKERAMSLFLAYDADGSGSIERKELTTLLKDLLQIQLSREQWKFFVDQTFAKADKDGSGSIDFDEFWPLYRKCLASPEVQAHFGDKVVLRYGKQGEWYLEAAPEDGGTLDQKEAAVARFLGNEKQDAAAEQASATRIQAAQRGKKERRALAQQHKAAVQVQKMARGKQSRHKRGPSTLGVIAPLTDPPSAELQAVFSELDEDADGVLQKADMVRLDERCGRSTVLDDATWLTLCQMVGVNDPAAGLKITDLQQYYMQAGEEELAEAYTALFAKELAAQTAAVSSTAFSAVSFASLLTPRVPHPQATRIQSRHRGKRGRRKAGEHRQEREHSEKAAVKIQARHRGKRGRQAASQRRTEFAETRQQENAAATRVQAIQRGKAARQHAAEQQAAAVKVQSIHRGRRGRDRAKRQRMQTGQASQEAAPAGSENVEQGVAPTDMDEELGAATRIQAAHRGKKGRQQLAAQHAAATKVQSVHRGRAGRGKARRRATTTDEKDAAVAAFVGAESEAEAAAPTPPVSAKPSMDAMVAAIFNHYDSDGDGYLRQLDVSRLEHETGEGGTVDDAAWEALCEMLEADKNVVSALAPSISYGGS